MVLDRSFDDKKHLLQEDVSIDFSDIQPCLLGWLHLHFLIFIKILDPQRCNISVDILLFEIYSKKKKYKYLHVMGSGYAR